MAKILFTAIVADIRGKIAGTVFSKNKGGAYARTKVTPTNPQTVAQQAARAVLIGFSQGWRALTTAQRTAWNAAVASFPKTNVFGNVRILSGHQLYVGLNSQISAANGSAISDPPVPQGADPVTALSAVAAAGTQLLTVTVAPTPIPADHALIIDATEQVSAGISNLNTKYRQIHVEAAAGTSPIDVTSEYQARFGNIIAGQKIGIRVRLVRLSTGETSGALTVEAIATP